MSLQLAPVPARESISRSTETDSNKVTMYELATCRAENYLLRQRMTDCEASVQSLKQMITDIAEKQEEVLNEVQELRQCVLKPPKKVADSSTNTDEDDISEPDTYMPDSDTEEIFSSFNSPQASSDSEPELTVSPLEPYDLATNTMPAWSILYSITEEIEPEDSQEDVIEYQDEPEQGQEQEQEDEDEDEEEDEDSQPLEDNWADEADDN